MNGGFLEFVMLGLIPPLVLAAIVFWIVAMPLFVYRRKQRQRIEIVENHQLFEHWTQDMPDNGKTP